MDYKGDLKAFLDQTCERLNNAWSQKENDIKTDFANLEKAVEFAFDLFEKYPFARRYRKETSRSFNRCIFELLSYYFSDDNVRTVVSEKKEIFVEKFIELNEDQEFNQAIEGYPKMTDKVIIRFNAFVDLLRSLDDSGLIGYLPKYKIENANIEVV